MIKVFAIIIVFISLMACSDDHSAKNTRTDLEKNITGNEADYKLLVSKFESLSKDSIKIVTFGNSPNAKITLRYYRADDYSGDKKIIGRNDLKLGSTELNEVLDSLNWSSKDLTDLSNLLQKTGCDYIRHYPTWGNPLNIYNEPSSYSNCDFLIYPKDVLTITYKKRGKPIGRSNFLERVYVSCTGTL